MYVHTHVHLIAYIRGYLKIIELLISCTKLSAKYYQFLMNQQFSLSLCFFFFYQKSTVTVTFLLKQMFYNFIFYIN